MPLPSTYADTNCSMARTLEVIGERWTLLIIRDAFYGVRRFGDFATQLGIPRAVLTSRLRSLVQEGVLARASESAAPIEYTLTAKGLELWPAIRALMAWGDDFYAPSGAKRVLRHDDDRALVHADGRCRGCGQLVPVPELRLEPGPGFEPAGGNEDPISAAINKPRRLLEPVRNANAI